MSRLQELVDSHAAVIGRGIGVTDRQFYSLAHSTLMGFDLDAVASSTILRRRAAEPVIEWVESNGIASADGPVRLPANPTLSMGRRVCVPVRFNGLLLGYLWIIEEPATLSPESLEAASRAATDLGAELYRLRHLEDEAREREAGVLRDLFVGGDRAADASRQIERLLTRSRCYVAAVADGTVLHPTEPGRVGAQIGAALGHVRRSRAPGEVVAGVADDRGLLVLAIGHTEAAEHQGDAVLSAARQVTDAGQMTLSVGVGLAVGLITDLQVSFRQAALAVRMAHKRGAAHMAVWWGSLGADRTIVALLGERDPSPFVPDSIRRLLDTPGGAVLLETLQVYLDLAGDAQAAAHMLFVHRSTLYHRLHRIEQITGRDLRGGDDRLELHIGLRLARLLAAPAEEVAQAG
jgi:hypothetical protein